MTPLDADAVSAAPFDEFAALLAGVVAADIWSSWQSEARGRRTAGVRAQLTARRAGQA
ncbi:MAG: hypothetical protein M3Q22_10620 [Actinomycetota bacterium]|nr:hypothetical protein [Actinomycetota bacterium]